MTTHPFMHGVVPMRSALEVKIAVALDEHEVEWGYECPVVLPDGTSPRYLPDFTIYYADDDLELPKWLEVKPQDFIYNLANDTGIYRKYGQYFKGEVSVEWTADTLKNLGSELWKPKLLAELDMGDVLVTGAANATKTLSVTMRRNAIVFTRSQPFVNWNSVEKQRRDEERRRHQEMENLKWHRERELREHNLQVEREQARREHEENLVQFAKIVLAMPLKPLQYPQACYVCDEYGDDGSIYRLKFIDGERWYRVCEFCRAGLPARAAS